MMHTIYVILRRAELMVTGWGIEEWAIIAPILVVFAFITMRGFGNNSRL